jgi:hypothetical protein
MKGPLQPKPVGVFRDSAGGALGLEVK